MTDEPSIQERLEASSLGEPEAAALCESVSDEIARSILDRVNALSLPFNPEIITRADAVALDTWHAACHEELTTLQGIRAVVDALLFTVTGRAPLRHPAARR